MLNRSITEPKDKTITPGVSVVMAVYNDAQAVANTVHSVFKQLNEVANQSLAFEFILIDDGAEQAVKKQLDILAEQYPLLTVYAQENQGLTKALIHGCEQAQYEYISRIDAGDLMLEGRLAKQVSHLDCHAKIVLVSTWTRYVTREGYFLYDVKDSTNAINHSLALKPKGAYVSPQHFTVMFRQQAYQVVGGYRPEFYFAQDFDLWLRLAEYNMGGTSDEAGDSNVEGKSHKAYVIPESLTLSEYTANAISGAYSQEQADLLVLAVESARLRRAGESDADVLQKISQIRPNNKTVSPSSQSKSLYFIAACLLKNGQKKAARSYFFRCIKTTPLQLMAYIGIARTIL